MNSEKSVNQEPKPAPHSVEVLTGGGDTPASFWELDLHNLLKLKSFVHLGMPHVFKNLNKTFNLFEMRRRGLAPIVYMMDFHNALVPLAFGRKVTSTHEIRVHRYKPTAEEMAAGTASERLMEDIRIEYSGPRSQSSREQLGFDKSKGPMVKLGSGQILHVFTKPLGNSGERGVIDLPEEMSMMREHPWEGSYPTIDGLHDVPAGFAEQDAQRWTEYFSVWGLPNTDVNQHVNVVEYLMAAENHFTRMLYGCGVDIPGHRQQRLAMIFRKPFFPGNAYAIRGSIYRRDEQTMMNASIHLITPEGEPDPKASVGIRCEGTIVEAPADAAAGTPPPGSSGANS